MLLHRCLIFLLLMGSICSLTTADFPLTRLKRNSSQRLDGVHLVFAATNFPPHNVLTLGPDGNYSDTGSTPMFFAWLTEKLNFTISYYYLPNEMTESQFGTMGDIAILLKLIADKKVDGSARFIIETSERRKMVDFAHFMWAEPFAMVVPRPGEEPRLFAFVRPFQTTVWTFILIATFAIVGSLTVFARIYSELSIFIDSVSKVRRVPMFERSTEYLTYMINIMTNQGHVIHVNRLPFRILIGMWVLVATVLVNSYSGTVISYITVPKMKSPINNFEDLVSSKDVKLILLADTITKKQTLEASSGALKNLGDQIRQNPDRILNNLEKVNVYLESERYAFPNPQSFCNNFVASQFQKKGICRFKTTDPLSMTIFLSMSLQKGSKFKPAFQRALLDLWETGLPKFWVRKSMPPATKCFEKSKLQANAKLAIRLNDLTGAFLILGVGFSLATFAFFVEKMIHFKSPRKPLADHKEPLTCVSQ